MKGFFSHLLSRAQRVTADVYALMFLCDFFNFMVVIFGFASFGVSLCVCVYIYIFSFAVCNTGTASVF
jgi:hypothetical protein